MHADQKKHQLASSEASLGGLRLIVCASKPHHTVLSLVLCSCTKQPSAFVYTGCTKVLAAVKDAAAATESSGGWLRSGTQPL